jgi:hypothetical protein
MDDDITGMVNLDTSSSTYKLNHIEGQEFLSWVNTAFDTLSLGNARLFGVYPVRNGYFMKDHPYATLDLRFCVGSFWGCINDQSIEITIEEKEDFERTLLYYEKYGSILRYNHIAPLTTYYKTKGGMQSRNIDRIQSSRDSCQFLLNRFPRLCKPYRTKKNGIKDIRLISNAVKN